MDIGSSAASVTAEASLEGLSAWVSRVIAWADRLQRRHGVLGFWYAVLKKYRDDEGGGKPR